MIVPTAVAALTTCLVAAVSGAYAARPQASSQTPPNRVAAETPRAPLVVSFTAPYAYGRRDEDGKPIVRGFRVGYFRDRKNTPDWIVDFVDSLPAADSRGEVTLELPKSRLIPGSSYMIRLKTLGTQAESRWSGPTARFAIQASGVLVREVEPMSAARSDRARTNSPKRAAPPRPSRILQELARDPALATRLAPLLPKGIDLAEATSGFRRVRDFAAAAQAALNLSVDFKELKRRLLGPPAIKLSDALRILAPAADAKAESRKALQQATARMTPPQPAKSSPGAVKGPKGSGQGASRQKSRL